MSPVERRTSRSTTTAILVALAGVVAGIGLVVFIVNLASRGGEDLQIRIGDDTFDAGGAEGRAESIAEGGPILFADVAGRNRDILLHHVGEDPETGWHAIGAAPPGQPRDCVLQWQGDDEVFEDCEGERYAVDDDALLSYPVEVEDGSVIVDLNAEFREDDAEGDEPG